MLNELFKFEGCNLNAKNVQGMTPLHIAVQHGHTESVEKLLSLGCNPNAMVTYVVIFIIMQAVWI